MFKCAICGREFERPAAIISHVKTHGYKDFALYEQQYGEVIDKLPSRCRICGEPIRKNLKYCGKECKDKDLDLKKARTGNFKNETNQKLKCKICGWETGDINGFAGHGRKHLKLKHNIIVDKLGYKEHYDIIDVIDNRPTMKCPLCDWETVDITNKSGAFTHHLSEKHQLTAAEFIVKYPEYRHLWKMVNLRMQRLEFINESNDNFIECQICHEKFKFISNSHIIKKHGISPNEYKKKYGSITSISYSKQLSELYKTGLALHGHTYVSKAEGEIKDFLLSLGISNIKTSVRNLINPQEVDIYLPDYNVAIEYDGLYNMKLYKIYNEL